MSGVPIIEASSSQKSLDFEEVLRAYQDPVYQLVDYVIEIKREQLWQWVEQAERGEQPFHFLKSCLKAETDLGERVQKLAEKKLEYFKISSEKENLPISHESAERESLEEINAQIQGCVHQIFGEEILQLMEQLAIELTERYFTVIVRTAEGLLESDALERLREAQFAKQQSETRKKCVRSRAPVNMELRSLKTELEEQEALKKEKEALEAEKRKQEAERAKLLQNIEETSREVLGFRERLKNLTTEKKQSEELIKTLEDQVALLKTDSSRITMERKRLEAILTEELQLSSAYEFPAFEERKRESLLTDLQKFMKQ